MQTHIAKWGASCAVRLPKMAVQMLGLTAGQSVDMTIKDGQLILTKSPPRHTLEEMVAQMDGCTQPGLELDAPPVGFEFGANDT